MRTRINRGLRWSAAAGLTVVLCTAAPAQAASIINNGTVAPGGSITISGTCDAPATDVLFEVRVDGFSETSIGIDVAGPAYGFSETIDVDDLDGGQSLVAGDLVHIEDGRCVGQDGNDPDEILDVLFAFQDGAFTVTGGTPNPDPDPEPDPEPEAETGSDPAPADEPAERGSSFDTGVDLQAAEDNSGPTTMTVLGGVAAVSGAMLLWMTRRRFADRKAEHTP